MEKDQAEKAARQKKRGNETLLTWQAQEYEVEEKTTDWFWALGVLAISASAASFILNNVLFGIFILIAAFLLALYVVKKPRVITFAITRRGVVVDGQMYPFQSLESYWIHTDPMDEYEPPQLLIKSKSLIAPLITIPISENINVEDVDDILKDVLELEEHSLPIAHRFLELFGF